MKVSNSVVTVSIIGIMLLTLGFACGDSNNSSSTTSTTNKAEDAPKPVTKDIAGEYAATGTNPDGKGGYKADLKVTKHDEVYEFDWTSAGRSYNGVGVVSGTHAAVAYTDGGNGKGCGVVLYQIGSDGTLSGRVGYWGVNQAETETATRNGSGGLEGAYSIKGNNPEGKEYTGKLNVEKAGEGYSFKWDAGNAFEGFGIRGGDMIAVGFGGKQCAFVGYDIKDDGTLDGKWGGAGSKTLGTEVAKKK